VNFHRERAIELHHQKVDWRRKKELVRYESKEAIREKRKNESVLGEGGRGLVLLRVSRGPGFRGRLSRIRKERRKTEGGREGIKVYFGGRALIIRHGAGKEGGEEKRRREWKKEVQ